MSKRKIISSTAAGSEKDGKKKKQNKVEVIDLCDSPPPPPSSLDNKTSPSRASSSSSSCAQANAQKGIKQQPKKLNNQKYKLFCDLDGVLVDFDKGVAALFHNKYKSTSAIPSHLLWPRINSSSNFFRDLSWTIDGMELWKILLELYCYHEHIEKLSILTGCPRNHSSKSQKFEWCKSHLRINIDIHPSNNNNHDDAGIEFKFVHVDKAAKKSRHEIVHNKAADHTSGMKKIKSMFKSPNTTCGISSSKSTSSSFTKSTQSQKVKKSIDVITCWSKNKHYESKKNHILIDDRLKLKSEWVSKGGIFIHHTNTKDTIRQLKACGIMDL